MKGKRDKNGWGGEGKERRNEVGNVIKLSKLAHFQETSLNWATSVVVQNAIVCN